MLSSLPTRSPAYVKVALVLLVVGALAAVHDGGCSSTSSSPQSSAAKATPGKGFDSAQAAVDALVAALRGDDQKELRGILGSEADDVLRSGDEVADANARADFLKQYDEKHQLEKRDDNSMTLDVGATDWPLPIPVVKGAKGWYFDVPAGLDELLSRRIGRNELAAIQVCLAIGDAQREYAAADDNGDGWREYAQKFKSDEGKKNGLFWPTKEGEAPSPLGDFVAGATSEGYKARTDGGTGPRAYHGYYYRILTSQGPAAPGGALDYVLKGHMIGGFAVVAWPAEYGNSGLKTFITSHHGDVYQKDLGDDTDTVARAMKTYNPDSTWEKCDTDQNDK
jgi:Protein of unknown function (DUF2950)